MSLKNPKFLHPIMTYGAKIGLLRKSDEKVFTLEVKILGTIFDH